MKNKNVYGLAFFDIFYYLLITGLLIAFILQIFRTLNTVYSWIVFVFLMVFYLKVSIRYIFKKIEFNEEYLKIISYNFLEKQETILYFKSGYFMHWPRIEISGNYLKQVAFLYFYPNEGKSINIVPLQIRKRDQLIEHIVAKIRNNDNYYMNIPPIPKYIKVYSKSIDNNELFAALEFYMESNNIEYKYYQNLDGFRFNENNKVNSYHFFPCFGNNFLRIKTFLIIKRKNKTIKKIFLGECKKFSKYIVGYRKGELIFHISQKVLDINLDKI